MRKSLFLIFLLFTTHNVSAQENILVSVDWLQQNLNKSGIRIIDMSDNMQYQRFHIPGAVHLPYEAINQRNRQGVSLSAGTDHIVKVLGLLGITADMQLVIYDDTGGLHASRLFWELERLGHQRIALLNGGLVKWILSGYKVDASYPKVTPREYKPAKVAAASNLATLEDITSNNKQHLLDVRTKEEYIGHPKQPRSGHIPNAKWWEWQQAVNFDDAFQLQQPGIIQGQLSGLGLSDKKAPVVLYCRSGHRASHSYFVLRNLGYQNVKLYDASMLEYEQAKSLPITKGVSP